MASTVFPKAKEQMLQGGIDLNTSTVKAVLIDTNDHAYNSADEFYSDITGAAIVGTPTAITSKTFTNGVFDGADVTLSSVTGDQSEAVLIFIDTGVPSTSRLIAWIDSGTGLPVTPGGGDITLAWDSGANKIFAL